MTVEKVIAVFNSITGAAWLVVIAAVWLALATIYTEAQKEGRPKMHFASFLFLTCPVAFTLALIVMKIFW